PELAANEAGSVNCVQGTGGLRLNNSAGGIVNNVVEPDFTRLSDHIIIDPFSTLTNGNQVTFSSDTELALPGIVGGLTETDVTGSDVANGFGIDILLPSGSRFIFISDPTSSEVPEPSTGLLLWAALPAIWGIRRFSKV